MSRSTPLSAALLCAVTLMLAGATRAHAQVSATPAVSVIGLVVDSITGQPIPAARVSLGVDGPGVATNGLGQFALPNVPLGTRRIVVSRLGYQDLEAIVQITDPMGGVRLRIAPDPVQLEGITIGGRSDDIRGRVVDADTGEPIPYAQMTLTKDGVRKIGRRFRSTDTLGNFLLPDVSTGGYVIKVERPGYATRLQQIAHTGDGTPHLITLSHDARRVAALNALMAELDSGLAAAPKSASLGEAKIQSAVMTTLDGFLASEGPPGWGFDPAPPSARLDYGRNAEKQAVVYIAGELPTSDGPGTFSPKAFYRIDYLECAFATGSPPSRFRMVIAYTYEYIEERMLNPNKKDPIDPDRHLEWCLKPE